MSNDLWKELRPRCDALVFPLGFKRKNRTYYRLSDSMLQCFSYEGLGRTDICMEYFDEERQRKVYVFVCDGKHCRINFSIFPLSMKLEQFYISHGVALYNLKCFRPKRNSLDENGDCFVYPRDENGTIACAEDMTDYLQEHLLPFFGRCRTAEAALQEMIQLEGTRYYTEPFSETNIRYMEGRKRYFAIETGDYAFAIRCFKATAAQNQSAIDDRTQRNYNLEKKPEIQQRIEGCKEAIRHLKENDTQYWKEVLKKNTEASMEVLHALKWY